jgi:hypothetical protein
MNRDYSFTAYIVSGLVYSTLYFREYLPVKTNSRPRADLFPWFNFWTAGVTASVEWSGGARWFLLFDLRRKIFNTENAEKGGAKPGE